MKNLCYMIHDSIVIVVHYKQHVLRLAAENLFATLWKDMPNDQASNMVSADKICEFLVS